MQNIKVQKRKSLKDLSTFGIGGEASYFTVCKTEKELSKALQYAREKRLPFFVIGKGSNVLFPDGGLKALVIQNRIDHMSISKNLVHAGSGYSFSLLGMKTAKAGLSGLEFASGIPASVGGAVFMNAGASGKETKDVVESVSYIHADGEQETFSRENIEFSYRYSIFHKMKGVIAAAAFCLEKDHSARSRQLEIIEYRKKTQPLKEKSAGCVFRNPENVSASKLIDECGLKGKRMGGAEVSQMHANFIINASNASQEDVLSLMEYIQNVVYEKKGILLQKEVRVIDENLSC